VIVVELAEDLLKKSNGQLHTYVHQSASSPGCKYNAVEFASFILHRLLASQGYEEGQK
jgi:hypothetical protein